MGYATTNDATTNDVKTNDATTNDATTNDAATNDAATNDATTNDATTKKCYNEEFFINKIRMLQRKWRNIIGRRSRRFRKTGGDFPALIRT